MCSATHSGVHSQTGGAEEYSSCLLSLVSPGKTSGSWLGQGFCWPVLLHKLEAGTSNAAQW